MIKYIYNAYLWVLDNNNVLIFGIGLFGIIFTALEIVIFMTVFIFLGLAPLDDVGIRAIIVLGVIQIIPIVIYALRSKKDEK